VRIGVEGGGDEAGANGSGKVNGSEVISGTTNAGGQFPVTFTSGVVPGTVGVRAELLNNGIGVRDDRIEILLLNDGSTLFLPTIER
jgi:hypothetical protein